MVYIHLDIKKRETEGKKISLEKQLELCFFVGVKTKYSESFLESMKVILIRTPSKGNYGHFL